jgi:aspartyl protease family protein
MSPLIAYLLFLPMDFLPMQEALSPAQVAFQTAPEIAGPLASTVPPMAMAEASTEVAESRFAQALAVANKQIYRSLVEIGPIGPIVTAPAEQSATLWRADDGLFYVDARINGAMVKLIVDTGASMTVLSPDDARRAGVDPSAAAFSDTAQTAAGSSPMARVTLASMQVGETSASSVSAVVASQQLAFSLLGQNWLSRLGSVTIEGDRMTLR